MDPLQRPQPNLSKGTKSEAKSSEGTGGGSAEKLSKEADGEEIEKKPRGVMTKKTNKRDPVRRPKVVEKESRNEKATSKVTQSSDVASKSVQTMKLTSLAMATAKPQTIMRTAKLPVTGSKEKVKDEVKDGEEHDGGYEMCGDMSADELKKIADAAP